MQTESGQPADGTISPIQGEPTVEARRLIALAQEKGLILRTLGGVAVGLRCPHASQPPLKRSYGDIDFMATKKQGRAIRDIFESAGYVANKHFNALHGDQRLLFLDEAFGRHVDVFLNTFKMCHTLMLEPRLSLHALTISPADLLLTKLQIIQLNMKDIQDLFALLLDFEPATSPANPGDQLDLSLIIQTCGTNWGWYTTVQDNLAILHKKVTDMLPPVEATQVQERIAGYKLALEQAPKSFSWRARAQVGRRLPWYEMPEEVER